MSSRKLTKMQSVAIIAIVVVAVLAGGYYATTMRPNLPSTSTTAETSMISSSSGLLYKDTIVIGTTDKLTTLDPATAAGYFSDSVILPNIGSGLVAVGPGSVGFVPDLAANWSVTPDGLTYTFNLRHDAKFSNGDPITAQTVIDSWNRAMSTQINGPSAYLLTTEINATDPHALVATDQYTLVVHLMIPFAAFLTVVALAAAPAYVVDPKVVNMTAPFTGAYVGSGPYMVKSWTPDVELDLTANPTYYGTAPLTNNIVFKFYADSSTLALAVQSGQVDIAYRSLNPTDVQSFKSNSNLKVLIGPGATPRYLDFNLRAAPFDNPNTSKMIRQALSYALNRTTIINSVFLGTVSPAYTVVPPGVFGEVDSFKTMYGPDGSLDKAKQILTQLGYTTSNPLKLDLWYTPSHYGGTEQSVVTIMKQEFESTGLISANLHSQEWATLIHLLVTGKASNPAVMLGWYPDYVDADDYLTGVYSSTDPLVFHSDKTIDNLLQVESTTTNQTLRLSALTQIQELTAADPVAIPLWIENQIAVTQPNVTGLVLDASQIFHLSTLQATSS